MKDILKKLSKFENLSYEETKTALNLIMDGDATDAQIASFLTALKLKGETPTEIFAGATVLREKMSRVNYEGECIDIVGTGGDCRDSFNISTCAAFIVSCFIPVAKHGNRNVSSKCGSADVLEELGAKINQDNISALRILKECNLSFMFAPNFHSSMKYVSDVRKELGFRTIFNILGPLSNPALAPYILLGVYKKELLEPISNALLDLKVKSALVVYSEDGLDEISIFKPTHCYEIRNNSIKKYIINPKEFGFNYDSLDEIKGANALTNASIIKDILNGQKGIKRDIVLLNSAAALYICGKAKSIEDGIDKACECIDSKAALNKLNDFINATKKVII